MASLLHTTGFGNVCGKATSIDFLADTLKVMLVTSTYTADKDTDFVDEAGANDLIDAEISVSGYTGGFGGGGRKTIGTKTITVNQSGGSPASTVIFNAANVTWTALGAGATIEGVELIKEITNDAASPAICYLDVSQATNGGDITCDFDDTNGIFKIAA